jgi:hypothetical protein
MAKLIKGADRFYLQKFKPAEKLVNPEYKTKSALPEAQLKTLAQQCLEYVKDCQVR